MSDNPEIRVEATEAESNKADEARLLEWMRQKDPSSSPLPGSEEMERQDQALIDARQVSHLEFMLDRERRQRRLAACWFTGIAALLLYGAYWGADSAGLIPHERAVYITADASWIRAESKSCVSFPVYAALAPSQDIDPNTRYLRCGGGPAHNVRVAFYSNINPSDEKVVLWQCKRTEASFNCVNPELQGLYFVNLDDSLTYQRADGRFIRVPK